MPPFPPPGHCLFLLSPLSQHACFAPPLQPSPLHVSPLPGWLRRVVLFLAGADSSVCMVGLDKGEMIGHAMRPKNASRPLALTLLDGSGIPLPLLHGQLLLAWANNNSLGAAAAAAAAAGGAVQRPRAGSAMRESEGRASRLRWVGGQAGRRVGGIWPRGPAGYGWRLRVLQSGAGAPVRAAESGPLANVDEALPDKPGRVKLCPRCQPAQLPSHPAMPPLLGAPLVRVPLPSLPAPMGSLSCASPPLPAACRSVRPPPSPPCPALARGGQRALTATAAGRAQTRSKVGPSSVPVPSVG